MLDVICFRVHRSQLCEDAAGDINGISGSLFGGLCSAVCWLIISGLHYRLRYSEEDSSKTTV